MAEYKGIKGFKVQSYATDPVATQFGAGTWASGGTMNTGRAYFQGFGATVPTAHAVGGDTGSPSALTESYNGSAWTEIGDVPTGLQNQASAGTSTSAMTSSGLSPTPSVSTNTYEWNGSSWTAGGACNTARYDLFGTGTEVAGLIAGGNNPSGTNYDNTETYNGSTWTEVNDMNSSATRGRAAAGTSTLAIAMGGEPPRGVLVESWDGTSWTETTDIPTATHGGRGAGTTTATLFYGGALPGGNTDGTYAYDGSAWAAGGNLSTAVAHMGAAGTQTSALSFGGTTGYKNTTEEWTLPSTFTQLNEGQIWYNTASAALKYTASAGAWASGAAMNTGRIQIASAVMSSTSSMMAAGGSLPGISAITELYNGTAWSETNDLTTPRRNAGGCSTVNTAVVIAGGQVPAVTNICELWNGTSWTEVNDMNTPRTGVAPGGAGSSTAGLIAGDYSGPPTNAVTANVEKWDGTSWTEVNNLNLARESAANFGTQTAAITAGGYGTDYSGTTEEYDGTSWAEKNDINTARGWMPGTGTTTAGLIYAGTTGSQTNLTESWDGTSWTELADCATSRQSAGGGGGLNTSAAIYGGETSTATVNTMEEWSFSDVVKTVTVS